MKRSLMVAAVVGLTVAFLPVAELVGDVQEAAQEQAVAPAQDAEPAAGLLFFAGGIAKAKRARTQTAGSTIGSVAWVSLPGAAVAYAVPAGTSDLLNVAFSAECAKIGGGLAYIRVLLSGPSTLPMEPYDAGQVICSSGLTATHKGNWALRVGPGSWTAVVQVRVSGGSVWLDDWTLELVAYE